MKVFIFLSSVLVFYFVYGFYISQNDITIVDPSFKSKTNDLFYDYKGVINIHSDQSIGSSPIPQIIRAANLSKLDFMMMTDLNTFNPPFSYEGYHEKTMVLIGQKLSYLDSRFIVYSQNKESIGATLSEAQTKLADLISQKTNKDFLIVLTHPKEKDFYWNGDLPQGIDGFELINLKSMTNRAWNLSKLSTIWSVFVYPFNIPLSFARIFNEPSEELSLLDQNSKLKFKAFAGSEASARAIPIANYLLKFPSYQRTFEMFTTHIQIRSELTGNAKTDKQKIFQALKAGNFYIAFDLLGSTTGFLCYLEDSGKILPMGSTTRKSKNLNLHINLPGKPTYYFEIVIYRNGTRYATLNSENVKLNLTESGTYRVQVRVSPYLPLPDARTWVTWIYTNPFFIND